MLGKGRKKNSCGSGTLLVFVHTDIKLPRVSVVVTFTVLFFTVLFFYCFKRIEVLVEDMCLTSFYGVWSTLSHL